MCTTYGELRLISIWYQKECLESKLVISCRMMHNWVKIYYILIDVSLTVRAETLIFISGRGSAISSAQEGK